MKKQRLSFIIASGLQPLKTVLRLITVGYSRIFKRGKFGIMRSLKSRLGYSHTLAACCLAYVTQSVAAMFLPLLFVRFGSEFGLSIESLTALITVTFFTQIFVDAAAPFIVEKTGYRALAVAAACFSFSGIAGLSFMADIIPGAFWGLFICTVLYAIGSGLIEVLITPIVDSCPTTKKAGSMAFVHSAYCAGCVLVVLLSTVFFAVFGIENWRVLALCFAAVPLVAAVSFLLVPIRTPEEVRERGSVKDMIKTPLFWIFGVVMICAGASELSMSQWASAFAEAGLGVSKTMGDLLGPCAFAFLMFIGRIIYGKISDRVDIIKIMLLCSALCVASYLTACFAKNPVVALMGCCVCGLAVAPMWPATFSLSSKYMPNISSAVFAAYALMGDLGCTGGPTAVGMLSGDSSNIAKGLSIAVIFPVVLAVCLVAVKLISRRKSCREANR